MRRSRRAKSIFTILSLVMAITVMLGSFMAFADESSDWRDRNRDEGPTSGEVNVLDKRDDKVYSWEKNLLNKSEGELSGLEEADGYEGNGALPIGLSGVHEVTIEDIPVGYSMTVTYDYFADEEPPIGFSYVEGEGDGVQLGFSVIVQDGDLVPDDAELSIAVEADLAEAESPLFKVLVNDNDLADEELDDPLLFEAKHKVTEDTVIVVEPVVMMISPMSFTDPNIITINNASDTDIGYNRHGYNDGGIYANPRYSHYYYCDRCNSASISAGSNNSTSAPGYNTTTYKHYQYTCDRKRYQDASGTTRVINIQQTPSNLVNGGANWWSELVTGSTYTSSTYNVTINNGAAASEVTLAAPISGTGKLTFTGPITIGSAITIGRPTNFGNGAHSGTPNYTPTQVTASGGAAGSITFTGNMTGYLTLTGQNVTVNGTGNIIGDGGTFNPGTAAGPGVISGAGAITVTNGTVTTRSSITGSGAVTMTGGVVSGSVMGGADSKNTPTTGVSGGHINGGTVGTTNGDLTLSPGSSITVTNATLSAVNGRVSLTASLGGTITLIEARTTTIPASVGSTITTIALRNGPAGATTTSVIDSCDIDTLYAGGDVTVNSPATINVKAYAGTRSGTLLVDADLKLNGIVQKTTGDPIPAVYGGGAVAIASPRTTKITVDDGTEATAIYLGSDISGATVHNATLDHEDATTGNIYGGSTLNGGNVTTAVINMNDGTVSNDIHGGSNNGASVSNTTVFMNEGTVTGNIYGGGASTGGIGTKAIINLVDGTVGENVYGGGSGAHTVAVSEVNFTDGTINGAGGIYGGGTAGTVTDAYVNINVDLDTTNLTHADSAIYGGGSDGKVTTSYVDVVSTATVDGRPVYGGSSGTVAGTTGTANVTINGGVKNENVYGGSSGAGATGITLVTIDGTVGVTGTPQNVYGGGSGTGDIDGTGQAKVVVNGEVIGNVFGGSTGDSDITTSGGTSVVIDDTAPGTVTGNVYGGNEDGGSVDNGTYIDNAGIIDGKLYGGCKEAGDVTGGTHITNTGDVTGEIYGGGDKGTVDTTSVSITDGQIDSDVFGGNENGETKKTATVSITDDADIQSGVTIYGGGNNGSPTGDTDVTISVDVPDCNVYGGGKDSPIVDLADTDGSTLIKITGDTIGSTTASSVYGGGRNTLGNANDARVEGKSSVVVNGATVTKNVYGGGDSAAVKETDVTIETGAQINGHVFGGGEDESTTADRAYVIENTLVKVNGGTVDLNVYGGGDADGNNVGIITGNQTRVATVQINTGLVKGNVYGGGLDSTADTTSVLVKAAVNKNVYGGGHTTTTDAKIRNDVQSYTPATQVEIATGAVVGIATTPFDGNVYGGGTGPSTNAQVSGNTQVTVSGGQVGHNSANDKTATVYGGGENNIVTGKTEVKVSGGTVWRDVFGGGLGTGGDVNGTGVTSPNPVSKVEITGGIVKGGTADGGHTTNYNVIGGGVYGGGYGNVANDAIVKGNTLVQMSGGQVETNVYGGGLDAQVTGDAYITMTNGTVGIVGNAFGGNVYGGGRDDKAPVKGGSGTIVKITNTAIVVHDVYGGGLDKALVDNNTDILIEAKVGSASPTDSPVSNTSGGDVVFGGGTGVLGTTIGQKTLVTIGGNADVKADVHGGGDGTGNHILGVDGAEIVTKDNATITGNVFGGGLDSQVKKTQVTHSATVNGTIWGGGVSRLTAAAPVTDSGTTVTLTGGKVNANTANSAFGDVHGGGFAANTNNADVTPFTNVKLENSSVVEGSVYGGGQVNGSATGEAEIKGDVTVEILSNSHVETDVWGGGHGEPTKADVTGDVTMKIVDGKVGTAKGQPDGNVWGGGHDSAIEGEITIDTDGATTIFGMVHGGGMAKAGDEDDAAVNKPYPGENDVITITFDGNTNVKGNVYGGGLFGHVYGSIEMDVKSKLFEENIYGGGQNADVEWNTRVHVYESADVGHSVYGGGIMDASMPFPPSNAYTNGGYTDVTIDGHIHGSVYGGGHRIDVMNNANYDGKGATVNITTNATIGDNPLIGNDTDNRGTVYGGGRDANIANANHGGTYVYLTGEAEVWWDVYGGGWNETGSPSDNLGHVHGPEGTLVRLNDNSWVHHNVYGGGRNFGNITHVNAGGTVVELNDFCKVGNPTPGTRGDVYGGGNKGHIKGKNGTKVTLNPDAIVYGTIYGGCYYADVEHPEAGTQVYIYGQVGDTYHTKSYNDARPSFYDGEIDYYGNPTARTGNVYGGGNNGNILGDKGTYMLVTDATSNRNKAIVWNSVYGGGFEGNVMFDTVVDVEGAAEVYNSVFGGGQQSDSSFQSDPQKALVHKTTTVNVTEPETKIGREDLTRLTENSSLIDFVENNDLELHTGRIFGGGDFATVKGNATVTVDSLAQKAFRTISGGSFGVLSINTPEDRNLILKNLGESTGYETADSEEWGPGIYDDLHYYTVIKHLHDYTRADVEDSFLTVYYHHRSVDDNSDFGLKYPGYTMNAPSGDYEAKYYGFGGKYHPWRPYPHKDIIVDPIFVPDFSKTAANGESTMFRMQAGYTIDMRPGGILCSNATIPQLLIDRAERRLTATSKVYGPSDNVMDPDSFIYGYLPNTLSPKNLNDRDSTAICGINFYIPPIEIKPIDGETTNHGGTDILDGTTGNTGAPEYEATDRTVSVKANEKDLTKKVQDAVDKTAKGKTTYVSESRYDQYTGEILTAVNKAAVDAGGKVILMADTMDGNRVQGRMYIDPSKVTGKTINSRVYTTSDRISQARVNFQSYYKNSFAFVHLAHEGAIGTEVEIAAKVNLDSLDTKNLIFYTYSTSTNSYKRIENPRYFIDQNGYLHFYTSVGGTVVITDKPLSRK